LRDEEGKENSRQIFIFTSDGFVSWSYGGALAAVELWGYQKERKE
jgi:hypothetical protein